MRKPPVTATPFTYRLARLSSTLHAGCGDGSDQPALYGQCTVSVTSLATVRVVRPLPPGPVMGLHHGRSLRQSGLPSWVYRSLGQRGALATEAAGTSCSINLPRSAKTTETSYLP